MYTRGRALGDFDWWLLTPMGAGQAAGEAVVESYRAVRGGACRTAPTWCDWVPGSDFLEICHPIDPLECQKSQFGPAMTPVSRERAIVEADKTIEAYNRLNPQGAAAYQSWLDWKPVYQLQLPQGGPSSLLPNAQNLGLWAAGAGVVALILLLKA